MSADVKQFKAMTKNERRTAAHSLVSYWVLPRAAAKPLQPRPPMAARNGENTAGGSPIAMGRRVHSLVFITPVTALPTGLTPRVG